MYIEDDVVTIKAVSTSGRVMELPVSVDFLIDADQYTILALVKHMKDCLRSEIRWPNQFSYKESRL